MDAEHESARVSAVAYGLGFAAGACLGMVIEQRLALGNWLVFLLTPKGPELAEVLRGGNFHVAEVKGHIREGDRTILCMEMPQPPAPTAGVARISTSDGSAQ